ncbi:protein kinase [Asanoa sp. NPDC050611]|uniref:protein kinase domain-containing protein n=1 Tax=Asanoa sp. NPDC050611 TaxID=3157098 RepID=UPI0033FBA37D
MSTLTPGALLARRYRLIDRVGAGGMSVIWRARDEVLDRTVAVKVLSAALAADARFRDMVRDEARAAAQLVHPHVATVHDYAETVTPDGTVTAFVVLELLTGEELEARLTAGPLPWPEAVRVCAEVASALAAAHRLGIVHRDVTPANVMLTPTGAKVLDFGIATRIGAPDEDADGETFGTPAYVAPERLDGTPAQPATDSYALGVLLYETLTGRVPLPAETWEDLTRALQADNGLAPPEVPGLPPVVAGLCMRLLARDPLDRPTAHIAARELRAAMAQPEPAAATDTAATSGPAPAPDPAAAPGPAFAPDLAAPGPAFAPGLAASGPESAPGAAASGPQPAPTPGAAPGTAPGTDPAPRHDPAPARGQRPTTGPVAPPAVAAEPAGSRRRPALVVAAIAAVLALGTAALVPLFRDDSPHVAAPATPPPTTSPPAPITAPPTPAPPTSIGEALRRVEGVIAEGQQAGDIRKDTAVDLRNLLRELHTAETRADRVTQLREKVAVRAGEGAISGPYAERLDVALAGFPAG